MIVIHILRGEDKIIYFLYLEGNFMAITVQDFMNMIEANDIKMIDFKIVDINGQYRHVTIPVQQFSADTLTSGIGFDASNYGYAVIEKATWYLFRIWILPL